MTAVKFADGLTSMASSMAGYRDGPFVGQFPNGYAKDGKYLYNISWIARQVVERVAEDCFRKGYSWVADADQVNLLESLEKRLKIKKLKKSAQMLARLDGEAYLYFDVGDSRESEPLDLNRVGRDALKFVNLFPMNKLRPGETDNDPMSPYYGTPKYYTVSSANGGAIYIHPSRVCRVTANPDPATGKGRPVLQHMQQPICSAESARDNTVGLVEQARLHIIGVQGLMDRMSDPDEEAALVKRFSAMQSMMRTNSLLVMDLEGEQYDSKQAQFSTLPDIIESMRREVAAAAEIPHALLFGREGGLGTNGETELKSYYDSIQSMQVTEIQPAFEPLDEVVIRSALGNRPDEIYIEWMPLYQTSESERAAIAKTTADTVKVLIDSGVMPAEVLTGPVVTALAEQGALPGLEGSYKEWQDAGGELDEPDVDAASPSPDFAEEVQNARIAT